MPFFQSLSHIFTGGGASSSSTQRHSREARRSVVNSTFDAFSLPTTQNVGAGFGQSMGRDGSSSSPGPSRRGSYATYPPDSEAARHALAYFPPLSHTFHRLRAALADSFPELLETLNRPVDPSLLAAFEAELGCPLPPPVRDCYLIADGQDLEATGNISGSGGLFFGLHLLPLEEVMREWAFWRSAEHDPAAGNNPAVLATMASIPPKWIKPLYACRGWLPLLSDRTGNYVGVDLDPGPEGKWGQVIVFGRDFDRKCVLWRGEGEGGWGKWLAAFVDELESGEGWEADKSNSSDEEEEAGFGSYNGGGIYGEAGKGLRLAGEYRGWSVLEAWWDRSVRRWEGLGLGMDVEEIERGLEEARRLAGMDGKGKEREGVSGYRGGESAAQVEIPVVGSPQIPPQPGTPVPGDSDVLLPPASPDNVPVPKIRYASPSPLRLITPVTVTSTDHPLKDNADAGPSTAVGYLSPPSRSPPRQPQPRRSSTLPTPAPLDLPTRADVQAMAAIASVEAAGLRGGWVMNLEVPPAARKYRSSIDSEMVDIDLEGGKAEKFGSPIMTDVELAQQRDEEKLALAGLEHRRSPQLIQSRTPSPLSREPSLDVAFGQEQTPRAALRDDPPGAGPIPASVIAATSALRRPPPVANHADSIRRDSDERHRVIRSGSQSRLERESSVISTDSNDGLLERERQLSFNSADGSIGPMLNSPLESPRPFGTASPTIHVTPPPSAPASPPRSNLRLVGGEAVPTPLGLEDEMEEVSLDSAATPLAQSPTSPITPMSAVSAISTTQSDMSGVSSSTSVAPGRDKQRAPMRDDMGPVARAKAKLGVVG